MKKKAIDLMGGMPTELKDVTWNANIIASVCLLLSEMVGEDDFQAEVGNLMNKKAMELCNKEMEDGN